MQRFIFNRQTLITVAVLVVGCILYFVVPHFKKSFEDLGVEPSAWAVSLIWISDMVVKYVYLAPVILLALYLSKLHLRTASDRTQCA